MGDRAQLLPAPASGPSQIVPFREPEPDRVWERLLSGRDPATLQAYERDLRAFAAWVGAPDSRTAVARLLASSGPAANDVVQRWVDSMRAKPYAPATIARRLAPVRLAVELARAMGIASWDLAVKAPRAEKYRDTAGPEFETVKAVYAKLQESAGTWKGARDYAIVRMLYDMGLRRFEVQLLDLEHVDWKGAQVSVRGKRRDHRESFRLPKATAKILHAWTTHRGPAAGPLFLAQPGKGRQTATGRLSLRAVNRIVTAAGLKVDEHLWPHALRHSAVTRALDKSNGDVRSVQRFSRHKKLETLMIYDDNRKDLGGAVAEGLAEELP